MVLGWCTSGFGNNTFCSLGAYSQDSSPADTYYRDEISASTPATPNLPSDVYYNNNLRSSPPTSPGGSGMGGNIGTGAGQSTTPTGGPPTGPGGSGDSGNDPTGTQPTPIGSAKLPLLAGAMLYAVFSLYRSKCRRIKDI